MHLMIPRPRLAWPSTVLLLISIALAGPLGADPLLARAQQRSAAGDSESAARLYRSWLELNRDAPGSVKVFSRYFRVERYVPALLDSCERFLSTGAAADAGAQLILVAQLFELAGRVENARDAYLEAFDATGSETALLSSALLSLEMNDFDALARRRESIKGGGRFDSLLGSLISLHAGDGTPARSALLAFAASSQDRDLSLKAIWVVYASATAAGDQLSAAEAIRRLTTGFPGTPEAALASRLGASGKSAAVVVALPRPDLSAAWPDPRDDAAPAPAAAAKGSAEAAPAATPTEAPAGVDAAPVPPADAAAAAAATSPTHAPAADAVRMGVQAGAFQVRENADYLVTDLLKKGFHPSVREESIQGVVHYRVFAGTAMAAEQARDLLSRLIQSGFSGFLVAEK